MMMMVFEGSEDMAPDRPGGEKAKAGGSDIARRIASLTPTLPDRKVSDLRGIWLNAVRLIAKADPDDVLLLERFIERIEAEWEKRGASAGLSDDEYFQWPNTETYSGRRVITVGERDDTTSGMLAYLEYHVGREKGEPPGVRHAILDRVFSGSLPPVFDRDYLAQWGSPGSAQRLQKLAETLAARARSFKRRRNTSLDDAIRDWEADLDFLHEKYYVGKFGFAWPMRRTR